MLAVGKHRFQPLDESDEGEGPLLRVETHDADQLDGPVAIRLRIDAPKSDVDSVGKNRQRPSGGDRPHAAGDPLAHRGKPDPPAARAEHGSRGACEQWRVRNDGMKGEQHRNSAALCLERAAQGCWRYDAHMTMRDVDTLGRERFTDRMNAASRIHETKAWRARGVDAADAHAADVLGAGRRRDDDDVMTVADESSC